MDLENQEHRIERGPVAEAEEASVDAALPEAEATSSVETTVEAAAAPTSTPPSATGTASNSLLPESNASNERDDHPEDHEPEYLNLEILDEVVNGFPTAPGNDDDNDAALRLSSPLEENEENMSSDDMLDSSSLSDTNSVDPNFVAQIDNALEDLFFPNEVNEPVAPVIRDNFMQRLRRAIFSIDHENYNYRQNVNEPTQADRSLDNEDNNIQMDLGDNEDPVNVHERLEQEERNANSIRFDTNLPAEHAYMGENMHRVAGVNYLEAGQNNNMLLFTHQHLLFPGEILPLMVPSTVFDLEVFDAQNGILFGICFTYLNNSDQEKLYGVTCQIYERAPPANDKIMLKSRALQRFVTYRSQLCGPLQTINSHPEIRCYGIVEILPEIFLPEPLRCLNMGSMNRFRDNDSMRSSFKRFQAATTPWPAHVFEYYSINYVIEEARKLLSRHDIGIMPTDPIQLSFWLARNLNFPEFLLKKIFLTNSVNARMKIIENSFKENCTFLCRFCSNHVANCSEVFAMSKHGVQNQYCNSAGFIHETNTVYKCVRDAISYSGQPSTEFSWFPGYQWHIIICKICSRHIGWEFKAIQENLVPKVFFGLSSNSVRISAATNIPSNPRAVMYRIMRLARPSFR